MIRLASISDFDKIISLIDGEFTKEGFGFVNKAQVETEINKKRVLVAVKDTEIVGCRIGLGTVWNMIVSKKERGEGVGRQLIEYYRPHTIRVKNQPVGHLSKKQREEFTDPTGFYESLGYKFWGNQKAKNFWQRAGDKALFHREGELAHIAIYKDPAQVMPLEAEKEAGK